MQSKGSRTARWGRLSSAVGIALLALVSFGSSALAAPTPAITSAVEAYWKVGVPTTFTVTTAAFSTPPAFSLSAVAPAVVPAWITVTDNHDGTATLSGTAPSGQEGDHPVTITASNQVLVGGVPVGERAVQDFIIAVGTCVLVITSPNSATFVEGEAGSFQATATDTCTNGTEQWALTGTPPAGVDIDPYSGILSGTPAPGTAGSWSFGIHVSDGDFSADQAFTLTVGPPLVVTSSTFTVAEGAPFNGQVGSFTGGSSGFSASIAWGDGATSAGTIATNGAGGYNVSGSHTYAEEGSKSVVLTVTDAGTSRSSTLAETVTDATLISTNEGPQPIAANEGALFSGIVGTFFDQNSGATAGDFTAAIAWGDGLTSAGTIAAGGQGASFSVTGTHTYEEHGVLSGTVTITDVGGKTTTNSITATIAEVSPLVVTGRNIAATAGVAFTGQVASFNDPGSKEATSDYVVTIDWGDSTTASAPSSLVDPPGTIIVNGTHTYAAAGTYTITVRAREADGLFALGTGTATVTALPLTSAPPRQQPMGLLLVGVLGLLLAGGSLYGWRRRTAAG